MMIKNYNIKSIGIMPACRQGREGWKVDTNNNIPLFQSSNSKISSFCRKAFFFFILLSIFSHYSHAQQIISGDKKQQKKYVEKEIYDEEYGIKMYEKLNFMVGGDSVRNISKGYACQGWVEDYYANGQMLHRGYYVDGQLKMYKNYFDNGQLERDFKNEGFKGGSMIIYYKTGKLKANIQYHEGGVIHEEDYYENGQLSYIEEHTKDMQFVIKMDSYDEKGNPQSIFEVTDPKKKLYYKKEYNENGSGKIKEEGPMKYSKEAFDYVKEGKWKTYDDSGKLLSTDNYVEGSISSE